MRRLMARLSLRLHRHHSAQYGRRYGIWYAAVGLFGVLGTSEAEILVLRHQLNVLHRKPSKRLVFTSIDRMVLALDVRVPVRAFPGFSGGCELCRLLIQVRDHV